MRYLLALLILLLTTADVFGWNMSLAPGLSVKNALIYLSILALATRFVLQGGMRPQVPQIHLWFAILLTYATLTWLAAGILIRYKTFSLLTSGIELKGTLFDNAVIFVLFLYGTRTLQDAEFLLKCMLLAVATANAIAIGNVVGIFHIGITIVGTESNLVGRVFGAFGHANETAALIVCLLPAYIAAALSAARVATWLWVLAGASSGALLLLTGSRGGLMALTLTGIFGTYICRDLISWRRAAAVVVTIGAIALPLLAFASIVSGGALFHRLAEMIVNPGAEDDRTQIWRPVFDRMIATPLSLITGFGWGAYDALGPPIPTHNHYLFLWFELGIIGVGSFLMLIRELVRTSIRAAKNATDEVARYLIAFVYGIIGLSGAIFFTPLFKPWLYIWAYIGLTMRMAVITMQTAPSTIRNVHHSATAIRSPQTVTHRLRPRVSPKRILTFQDRRADDRER
jgi:O-antigen ligase